MKPRAGAMGEMGNQTPIIMMTVVVTISGQLARLWRKGNRLVRMTWMIRVWVRSDSTNQPVWNKRRVGRVPAVEDVEHHKKGRVVEDRTARADEQDEPGDSAFIDQGRGLAICSGSTSSVGMGTWEKS